MFQSHEQRKVAMLQPTTFHQGMQYFKDMNMSIKQHK